MLSPMATDLKGAVEGFDLSKDGKTLAFSVNEAGVSKLYLFDTASRRARPMTAVPQGVLGALSWHQNSRELGFSIANARSTSDVYSLDATTGAVTRWTEGELGGLVASELSEPELVRWQSFGGIEMSGFYHREPQRCTGERAVIVIF